MNVLFAPHTFLVFLCLFMWARGLWFCAFDENAGGLVPKALEYYCGVVECQRTCSKGYYFKIEKGLYNFPGLEKALENA